MCVGLSVCLSVFVSVSVSVCVWGGGGCECMVSAGKTNYTDFTSIRCDVKGIDNIQIEIIHYTV